MKRNQKRQKPKAEHRRQNHRPQVKTTEIVPVAQSPVHTITTTTGRTRKLSSDEIALLKRTCAKGTSDDEFSMFLWFCRNHEVDPIAQEVYCIMRWDSKRDIVGQDKDGKNIYQGGNKMTIQMGIGGLRGLAARKHKDYGSTDEPVWVFGERKTPAGKRIPEQVSVSVWKKGAERPTTATIFWDEFVPKDLATNAWKYDFWNNAPANQLAKCCESQSLKKAYPDLNNIYTKEELDRTADDYTPDGRQVVDDKGFAPSGRAVTYEAQNRSNMLEEKTGKISMAEREVMGKANVAQAEAIDRILLTSTDTKELVELCGLTQEEAVKIASKNAKKKTSPETAKPPIDVAPLMQTEYVDPAKSRCSECGSSFGVHLKTCSKFKPPTTSTAPALPQLEAETIGPDRFRIMGDIEQCFAMIEHYCKCTDGFWFCNLASVQEMQKFQERHKFQLTVLAAKQAEKPASPTKQNKEPIPPTLVKGVLSGVKEGKTSQGAQVLSVKIGTTVYPCFSKTLNPILLSCAIGIPCELWTDARHTIVGLKRLGTQEYEADGRTPVVPSIQRSEQVAGQRTFF